MANVTNFNAPSHNSEYTYKGRKKVMYFTNDVVKDVSNKTGFSVEVIKDVWDSYMESFKDYLIETDSLFYVLPYLGKFGTSIDGAKLTHKYYHKRFGKERDIVFDNEPFCKEYFIMKRYHNFAMANLRKRIYRSFRAKKYLKRSSICFTRDTYNVRIKDYNTLTKAPPHIPYDIYYDKCVMQNDYASKYYKERDYLSVTDTDTFNWYNEGKIRKIR